MKNLILHTLTILLIFSILSSPSMADPYPVPIPYSIINHSGKDLDFKYDKGNCMQGADKVTINNNQEKSLSAKMTNTCSGATSTWYRYSIYIAGTNEWVGYAEIGAYYAYVKNRENCRESVNIWGRAWDLKVKDVVVNYSPGYVCQFR